MMRETQFSRRALWLLALLLALVWFCNLDYRKLVRPDEGRYAEIPREMVATGDWLTPRLNGLKYFEKPALQYWATAAAYEAFGETHWAARLWPALTGFFGILFTAFAGMRLWGRQAGVYAGLICASTTLYIGIGHLLTLDMGVTAFLNAGVLCLALAQRETRPELSRNWMLAAWASLGLAILSKGLIGAVLPGGAFVVYSLICGDFAAWKKLQIGRGLLVLLLITAPWFVWVSMVNPDFAHFFFIHEHWDRFVNPGHKRTGVWYYFIPILLAGMLPWTLLMFSSLATAWRREPVEGFQTRRFLLVWCVLVFVFFSVSESKLPSYILPIFPALALLMGERATRLSPRVLFWSIAPVALIGAGLAIFSPHAVKFASDEVPVVLYQAYVPWLLVAGLVMLAGGALAAWWGGRGRNIAAITALGVTGLLANQIGLTGHESLAPASSSYYLVPQIQPYLKPGVPFYSLGMYEQTLPFYIKRTLTLVEYRDEMDFGLNQEPAKYVPDYVEFSRRWMLADAQGSLAIMNPSSLQYFDQHKLPYEIIARDTRRIVVRRP
ncbi:MAG: glycosyl transferase family 39 [Betaproteobacteria bacterium]|nr:glycosyl transferase family 39 [Betaproteobacteria bacterium]